jgi:hypothetical protein
MVCGAAQEIAGQKGFHGYVICPAIDQNKVNVTRTYIAVDWLGYKRIFSWR